MKFGYKLPTLFGFSLILSTLLHSCKSERDTNQELLQQLPYRLPMSVKPFHYKLELIPILDEIPGYERFMAIGKVWIQMICNEVTSSITLHAQDLAINETATVVKESTGNSLNILGTAYQIPYDFLTINLANPLQLGQTYELYIQYNATISRDRLDGMYLDSYVDPANQQTRYVATTTFAANTARRAFPCFDEPGLKAEFQISLGRSPDYHGLSNMHLNETTELNEIPGWLLDTFATSPKMSTYLVCMIISDLTYEEAIKDRPEAPTHRVYAPYYSIDKGGGKYSANLSSTVLTAFETYYDIAYPLQKLDNVALPQFFYSAMENWGLMTFNDRVLLFYPGETSTAQKYTLSLTVAHEVSHNFFGNLVTCNFWTHVWLNEGWATYASHLGLQMTYPEFKPWDQFVPDIYQVALKSDASVRTHPVANEPQTSEEIGRIYDDIAYKKGASLIRMAEKFISESILQTSVQRYLKKWQYGSPEQDDLFACVDEVIQEVNSTLLPSGITFKNIMDTWTLQAGFPLVTVYRVNSTSIALKQAQFVNNGIPSGNESWWIPVNIDVLSGPNPGRRVLWMGNDDSVVYFPMEETEVHVVNPDSIGYYRVMYTSGGLQEISDALNKNHELFKPESRMKLIDDALNLAFAGKLELELALELTSYINKESNPLVLETFLKALEDVAISFHETELNYAFVEYIKRKLMHCTVQAGTDIFSERLRRTWIVKDLQSKSMLNDPNEGAIRSPQINNIQNLTNDVIETFYKTQNSRRMILSALNVLGHDATRMEMEKIVSLIVKTSKAANSKNDISDLDYFISKNGEKLGQKLLSSIHRCMREIETRIHIRETFGFRIHSWIVQHLKMMDS